MRRFLLFHRYFRCRAWCIFDIKIIETDDEAEIVQDRLLRYQFFDFLEEKLKNMAKFLFAGFHLDAC